MTRRLLAWLLGGSDLQRTCPTCGYLPVKHHAACPERLDNQ